MRGTAAKSGITARERYDEATNELQILKHCFAILNTLSLGPKHHSCEARIQVNIDLFEDRVERDIPQLSIDVS